MNYFFLLMFSGLLCADPIDLTPMGKELTVLILYMDIPNEASPNDTCYHYGGLLKLDIDKNSKITNIQFNDSASALLKEGLEIQKQNKYIRYVQLDSIARALKLKDCSVIFPFVIESAIYPCGIGPNKPLAPYGYFLFNGQLLQGRIYFGGDVSLHYPVKVIGDHIVPKPGLKLPIKPPAVPGSIEKKTN